MTKPPRITPPTHHAIGELLPRINPLALPGAPAREVTDAVDDFERDSRRREVRPSWDLVPKHQLHWRCAPEFLRAISLWRPDRSLVLLGPTGTGKTSACARLVATLCKLAVAHGGEHMPPARSLYWVDADRLSRAGGEDTGEAREIIRRSSWARTFVLDDVATPSKTLQQVLRFRLSKRLPTVLTSGATSVSELKVALGGDAVVRHVLEATGVKGSIEIAKDVPRA